MPHLSIHPFSANDCGYIGTRYELIANWVHPLILKARAEASKEDNPNWKQAMLGPFKEEYWKAAVKEMLYPCFSPFCVQEEEHIGYQKGA